jgi:hypothetical protein
VTLQVLVAWLGSGFQIHCEVRVSDGTSVGSPAIGVGKGVGVGVSVGLVVGIGIPEIAT